MKTGEGRLTRRGRKVAALYKPFLHLPSSLLSQMLRLSTTYHSEIFKINHFPLLPTGLNDMRHKNKVIQRLFSLLLKSVLIQQALDVSHYTENKIISFWYPLLTSSLPSWSLCQPICHFSQFQLNTYMCITS